MNIKKTISNSLIILFFYAFTSCNSARKNHPDSILISGKIQNPAGKYMYFRSYPDSLSIYSGIKVNIDSVEVANTGNFTLEIKTNHPYAFDLACGDSTLVNNFFLTPGDEIKINFVGKHNKPELFPNGQEAKFNTYLLMYLDSFYRKPASMQVYYIGTNYMDIKTFAEYNEKRNKDELAFFKNYFGEDSLKKEFSDYALNTINYGIAVDRLMYLWKKRMKVENVHADSAYFAFATTAFIQNNTAFNCPAYIRFLNLYIKDKYERMIEDGTLHQDKTTALVPQVEKFKLAEQLLSRPYSDAVVYNIIRSDVTGVSGEHSGSDNIKIPLDTLISRFRIKYSIK